jgi:hypothetical protein
MQMHAKSALINKQQYTTENTVKKEGEKGIPKPEAKFKEPNSCWYCGQRWFFGHRCQQYKSVNLMTAEEQTDQNQEDQMNTNTSEEQETRATSPTEEELMQISVQAARGKCTKNTFTLSIQIGGKNTIALVDTGSTHTFLDLKFSTKINCKTITNSLETVLVAGGGELKRGLMWRISCGGYSVQGHSFHDSFKILPLNGYDIMLGGDLMLTHSPVRFDYITQAIKMKFYGKEKILLQDESLKKGVQLMSMAKVQKALAKGATGYCLFPLSSAVPMSPQEDKELQDMLNDFKDVFEEPVGLPPQRQCDHSKLGLNLLELDHTGFPISKKT